MQLIKQSTASQALTFFMVDSANRPNGKTGLSPTVVIQKEGGAFSTPAGSVTEIGVGYYQVEPNATDSDTLGGLLLSATASGADQGIQNYQIVAFNPFSATNLGLGSLPTSAPGAANGVLIAGSNSIVTFDFLQVTNDFVIDGSIAIAGLLSAASGITSGPVGIVGAMTVSGGIEATLSRVDTLTGNTPQTGDSYAQVVLIPRRNAGSFTHTNTSTAATATVAIT